MHGLLDGAGAHFQNTDRHIGAIDEMMAAARAGAKARCHALAECLFTFVRYQDDLAFENIDKLVLALVPMALGRPGARWQLEEIGPELRQSKYVSQRTPTAFTARRIVRCWIIRSDARREIRRLYRNGYRWHGPNLPVIR